MAEILGNYGSRSIKFTHFRDISLQKKNIYQKFGGGHGPRGPLTTPLLRNDEQCFVCIISPSIAMEGQPEKRHNVRAQQRRNQCLIG